MTKIQKKVLLIDMDGVVADFELGFLQAFRSKYPSEPYIPIPERTVFKIKDQYPEELKPKVRSIIEAPGFYRNLPMIKGSKSTIMEMYDMGLNFYFCSSPLSKYKNCVLEKYEWIEEQFGSNFTDKIILTRDKTVVQGDLLIDDKPEITGALEEPSWEHILYISPYNKNVEGKRRLSWENWKEILL